MIQVAIPLLQLKLQFLKVLFIIWKVLDNNHLDLLHGLAQKAFHEPIQINGLFVFFLLSFGVSRVRNQDLPFLCVYWLHTRLTIYNFLPFGYEPFDFPSGVPCICNRRFLDHVGHKIPAPTFAHSARLNLGLAPSQYLPATLGNHCSNHSHNTPVPFGHLQTLV